MERLGVTVNPNSVKVDNVAAVVVTADLPPFARAGSTIDVSVASIGDADNLAGGTLLMTPLKAADGKIYAVAQGSMVVGSLAFGGKAAKVQKIIRPLVVFLTEHWLSVKFHFHSVI